MPELSTMLREKQIMTLWKDYRKGLCRMQGPKFVCVRKYSVNPNDTWIIYSVQERVDYDDLWKYYIKIYVECKIKKVVSIRNLL
jgi:hypothetical protein